jgi:hypothetical protein
MASRKTRISAALRLVMAVAASLIVGCDMKSFDASEIPVLSERQRWEPWFTQAYKAEAISDPVQRCIEYPSPPNLEWPPAMVEALCRDIFTQVPQADTIKAFIDEQDWKGLKAHYDGFLARHYSGEDSEQILYRVFPRYSWHDEADMAGYTERWLKAQPQDAYANHMRAHYLLWKAWETRGEGYARDITPERARQAVATARQASLLLKRAIKVEPRLLPAHDSLIEASALGDQLELIPHILEAAAKQSPENFYVRFQAANYMRLIWGGSYEKLDALAADAEPYLDRNPRLNMLLGKSKGQLAQVRTRGKHYGRALSAAREALEHGPDDEILELAILASDEVGFESETLVYLSQVARFNRSPKNQLLRRGWLWEQNGYYAWALSDYRAAQKIPLEDPDLNERIAEIERKMAAVKKPR